MITIVSKPTLQSAVAAFLKAHRGTLRIIEEQLWPEGWKPEKHPGRAEFLALMEKLSQIGEGARPSTLPNMDDIEIFQAARADAASGWGATRTPNIELAEFINTAQQAFTAIVRGIGREEFAIPSPDTPSDIVPARAAARAVETMLEFIGRHRDVFAQLPLRLSSRNDVDDLRKTWDVLVQHTRPDSNSAAWHPGYEAFAARTIANTANILEAVNNELAEIPGNSLNLLAAIDEFRQRVEPHWRDCFTENAAERLNTAISTVRERQKTSGRAKGGAAVMR